MSASPPTSPDLSVILATAGRFPNIRTVWRHLQRQTMAARLEVIVLAPETNDFGMDSAETASFHSVKLIALGRLTPLGLANAAGVRHASAPVIVFAEDHGYPEKGWAEALIARHQEDWAAVGPVLKNANPRTATSWSEFLLGYGPWHSDQPGGPAKMLPGHHCSYKKSILLGQGEKLPPLLQAESVLHEALIESGERLYLENRAVVSHLNFARLGALLPVQFRQGLVYGACRSAKWSAGKRAFYALAWPLIPLVRFPRILRSGIRLPPRFSRLRFMATLLVILSVDAFGQAIGYVGGAGSMAESLAEYEYDRYRFVTPSESEAVRAL